MVMEKNPSRFMEQSFVTKRDGKQEEFKFDKISLRLQVLKDAVEAFYQNEYGIKKKLHVNVTQLAQRSIKDMYSNMTTVELDYIAAEAAAFTPYHPDYQHFAGCILASNHQKCNKDVVKFRDYVKKARSYYHPTTGEACPLVSDFVSQIAEQYGEELEACIDHERDYLFDIFAMQTLLRNSYLLGTYQKKTKKGNHVFDVPSVVPFETPQHYFMRVAIGLFEQVFKENPGQTIEQIKETYHMMSKHEYTHATPTMFHCGTPNPTLISCFLLTMGRERDSVEGMYETIKECALISKGAGGIGVDISDIRPRGSYIKGTNGISNGLTPLIRVFNGTARHIDQGGGKRKGAFAMYIEPWHADFMEFLDLKKNNGAEEDRARDLFYGMFACRLFFKRWAEALQRVKTGDKSPVLWTFMDPHVCPGLTETYGDEFEQLYESYEAKGTFVRQIDILEVKEKLLGTMIETGTPYIVQKDECNEKNNQKNIGMVRSSNLCVAPDTPILTRKGYIPIGELENQKVEVWNGEEWSPTTVYQTATMAKVMKVEFSDGSHLICTPEHKFYIQENKEEAVKEVKAQELRKGLKLLPFTLPDPRTFDSDLIQRVDKTIMEGIISENRLSFKGTREYLETKRLSLQTLGIFSQIQGNTLLTHDDAASILFSFLGNNPMPSTCQSNVFVTSVNFDMGQTPTFCFTEEKRHMGVFNGHLTGQCSEIVEVAEPGKPASCNLCSLNLRAFYDHKTNSFNFQKFRNVIDRAVWNTNSVIDINKYPFEGAKEANLNHRPIGVGVQGWANLLGELQLGFDSEEAYKLNRHIFETLAYQCWRTSCDIAKVKGHYPSMKWNGGSPLSQGIFPWEQWQDTKPDPELKLPWDELRTDIMEHGTANSLTVALMPTASTSQIFGNQEGTEPFYAKYYARKTKAGEFFVIDPYLVRDLMEVGLWVGEFQNNHFVIPLRKKIFEAQGSVQNIKEIPAEIRERHKTIWEMKAKVSVKMARDRAPWVDQSMSFNVNLKNSKMTKSQLEAYILNVALVQRLKTIVYYTRTVQNSKALAFFRGEVDKNLKEEFEVEEVINRESSPSPTQPLVSSMDALSPSCNMDEDCLVCSS